MSSIAAGTTTGSALVSTGDTTGELVLKTNGTTTAVTIGTDQNVTFAGAVSSTALTVNSNNISAENSLGFRNRIINGNMVIDQRNAGASVTINTAAVNYTVDRWSAFGQATDGVYTVSRSTTVPSSAGFVNSLVATCTTADTSISATNRYFLNQAIEGYNFADFNFGTASAKSVTLSFWVRSSLTGTYCVTLINSDGTRSYVAEYTISAADTWEQKSVTIAGDTAGTWVTDNGIGVSVRFALAIGSTYQTTANTWASGNYNATSNQVNWMSSSSSRTFYITGVQLEVGSVATPFERRPYGTELSLCQRYFQKSYDQANALGTVTTTGEIRWQAASTGGESAPTIMLPVVMRAAPTLTLYSAATGASGNVRNYSTAANVVMTTANVIGSRGWSGGSTGFTAGQIIGYQFAASSEL